MPGCSEETIVSSTWKGFLDPIERGLNTADQLLAPWTVSILSALVPWASATLREEEQS